MKQWTPAINYGINNLLMKPKRHVYKSAKIKKNLKNTLTLFSIHAKTKKTSMELFFLRLPVESIAKATTSKETYVEGCSW